MLATLRALLILAVCLALEIPGETARAQQTPSPAADTELRELPQVAPTVGVAPAADDEAIASRLRRILRATGWYESLTVRVDEGVVFLSGVARSERHRDWASTLAANTEDVVAVVDEIEIPPTLDWDLSPAWNELKRLGNALVRKTPLLIAGLLVLIASWFAAKGTSRISSAILQRRVRNTLLRSVIARTLAVPVFLLGLYLILKVSGLTRLAVWSRHSVPPP